jgi:hypothetical protein
VAIMSIKKWNFVATMAWKLWLRWNVVVFRRTFGHPSLLVTNALDSLETFRNANFRIKDKGSS